jgi:hypothetical protein
MDDRTTARDNIAATLIRSGVLIDFTKPIGIFSAECLDKDGCVKWRDTAPNVVTTQGKNDWLDKYLDRATAHAACVMGLHTTVGNAGSTYNAPTPQAEATSGVYALRIAPAWSAAGTPTPAAKQTSAAVSFPIIGTATITGCFIALGIAGITAVGHTTVGSILFSSGSFSVARPVVNGDTLNVTYSMTLT